MSEDNRRFTAAELEMHLRATGIEPNELAGLLGVSTRAVRRWRSGERRSTVEAAQLLRDELRHTQVAVAAVDAWVAREDKDAVLHLRQDDPAARATYTHALLKHPHLRVAYREPAAGE